MLTTPGIGGRPFLASLPASRPSPPRSAPAFFLAYVKAVRCCLGGRAERAIEGIQGLIPVHGGSEMGFSHRRRMRKPAEWRGRINGALEMAAYDAFSDCARWSETFRGLESQMWCRGNTMRQRDPGKVSWAAIVDRGNAVSASQWTLIRNSRAVCRLRFRVARPLEPPRTLNAPGKLVVGRRLGDSGGDAMSRACSQPEQQGRRSTCNMSLLFFLGQSTSQLIPAWDGQGSEGHVTRYLATPNSRYVLLINCIK